MKTAKCYICLILAIIFSFSVCTAASAATPRASLYLSSYGAYCYAEDDGSVSVWFEVYGTGVEEVLGVLTIIVEERAPGSTSWSHVQTFTHTDYPHLLSYNNDFHWGGVDCENVTPGYICRATVTIWGGGMEIGDARYIVTSEVIAKNP